MKSTDELRDRVAALQTEIRELADLDEATEDQTARLDTATDEFVAARDELEQVEAREARIAEVRDYAVKHPERVERQAKNDPVVGMRDDPFNLADARGEMFRMDEVARGRELRARAHDALESMEFAGIPGRHVSSDDARQAMAEKIDQDTGGKIAEHILTYGSPEYTDAFFRYFTGKGHAGDAMAAAEARTAMSLTAGNGGALIPAHLDPSVIMTNTGTVNPFRQIARIESITKNVWNGVSSDGVQAGFIAEATEVTDGSPTFAQPAITCFKGFAHAFASREVIEDADNLGALVATLFADGKDRIESDKFANGSGSGEPFGIVSALNLTTASRTAANTNGVFGSVDVFNLVNNLPARWQQNAVWVAHWFTYNLVRQMGGPQTPNFWVDLGPGIPSQLLGRSVYQSSQILNAASAVGLSSATASSDNILILGDFSNFIIVDRIGMEVVYDPLVLGSNRRPTGQMSWTAFWRVGSDSVADAAFQMLRV